jgi:CHASE3 domain sensor protein
VIADPHKLQTATNVGGIFGLRPGELPMDRALEMSRRLEQCVMDNQMLVARINTLMAEASAREHALNEGIRDVRRAAEEVEKTRLDLAQARKDMDALRERMKRAEAEEIETLKAVIEVIQKLIRNQNEAP